MFKISNFVVGISVLSIAKSATASNLSLETNLKFVPSCDPISSRVFPLVSNVQQQEARKDIDRINRPGFSVNLPQASIWWAAAQFDPFGGNLIQDWLTHPNKQQVDLTVNWQLWSLLDYFERYRFVHQFGTVIRNYGYSLNIFNQKEQCLATYKYNAVSNPPKWELHLDKLGEDSLQIEPL